MIIRPIRKDDLDQFEELALSASLGITNLPKNRKLLEDKIEDSLKAFSKNIKEPQDERYIFVLEDTKTSKIGGTCGILSKTAVTNPLYYYKLKKIKLNQSPHQIEVLKAVSHKNEPSEIAALYLHPDFRHSGLGKLLSFSRFMFVASFKERFEKQFFAEIRGVITDEGVCHFWEGVGRHFLDVNYTKLMDMAAIGREFVPEILPKHPIYLTLLPKEVQDIIGKSHEKSSAALKMLESQGFKFKDEIDIFDGGPRIFAKTSKIKVVRKSVTGYVKKIVDEPLNSHKKYLVSNEKLDFRAGLINLKFQGKSEVDIARSDAEALRLHVGDKVRYIDI